MLCVQVRPVFAQNLHHLVEVPIGGEVHWVEPEGISPIGQRRVQLQQELHGIHVISFDAVEKEVHYLLHPLLLEGLLRRFGFCFFAGFLDHSPQFQVVETKGLVQASFGVKHSIDVLLDVVHYFEADFFILQILEVPAVLVLVLGFAQIHLGATNGRLERARTQRLCPFGLGRKERLLVLLFEFGNEGLVDLQVLLVLLHVFEEVGEGLVACLSPKHLPRRVGLGVAFLCFLLLLILEEEVSGAGGSEFFLFLEFLQEDQKAHLFLIVFFKIHL